MASRRISSLLSRSAAYYVSLSSSGRSSCTRSGGYRYSTATAINKPIARPLEDNYTKLLINQRFPHAASGRSFCMRSGLINRYSASAATRPPEGEMSLSEGNTISLGNCDCGNPVVLRKSWTPDNPGRRFEGCKLSNPNVKRGCDHFKWYDQDQTEWQKKVITDLLTEKRGFDNTSFVDINKVISFLKEEKNKVNAENEALKIKNNQLVVELKLAKKNEEDLREIGGMLLCVIMFGCMLLFIKMLLF